jgi:hypothetical protein
MFMFIKKADAGSCELLSTILKTLPGRNNPQHAEMKTFTGRKEM